MKCLSIWNPWASLVVHGHKTIETRTWPAPKGLVGQTLGIASTKLIRADQRRAYLNADFRTFYSITGLPELDKLQHGCLLGTVLLTECIEIDQAFIANLPAEERTFGWYSVGRYAWRLARPRALKIPMRVTGSQGLWSFEGAFELEADREEQKEQTGLWSDLSSPIWS